MFYHCLVRSSIARRIVCVTLLAVLACGVVGLPVSSPPSENVGRFPCENCPCGCSSAEFCWDKCCCHTDLEKLEWAEKHDVQPPDFLIARVGASKANPFLISGTETQSAESCCCCSAKTSSQCSEISEPKSDSDDESSVLPRVVLLEDAAKCRGIELLWTMLSSVVVQQSSDCLAMINPPLLYFLSVGDDNIVTVARCPDPPVP